MARLGIRAPLLLAASIAGAACSVGERLEPGFDAGVIPSFDGGMTMSDAAAPSDERDDLCYDEVDNDFNGALDCEEEACRADVVCCVASERSDCCAAEAETRSLSIDCDDGALTEGCLGSDARVFGGVAPTIEDGALVPQGGAGHGGVVLGPAIDPRAANLRLGATIEVPAARCAGACVDAAGVALLDAIPQAGAPAIVRFGILVSGSRDEVVVLFADEPIARAPITPGTGAYQIDIDVTGSARAIAGEEELARVDDLELPPQAYLAVFGRTDNRGPGEDAIRVRSATLTTRACDVPAALAREPSPIVPWSGATWDPREVRRPSVVAWTAEATTPRALMAFGHEGRIHLASRTGAGEFRNASFDPGPEAFAMPEELAAARDPWLLIHEGRFVLFFIGVDDTGRTSLWKTTGGANYAQTFGAPVQVLVPEDLDLDGIDGPAVVVGEPTWAMVARVRDERTHRIVRFVSPDAGLSWALTGETLREPQPHDLFAFDRDEIAAPALVTYRDARGRPIERLYYAGRRGTEWRIGLLASSDGRRWLPIGPVLGPDEGFDALGVTEPAPLVEGGALRLYYVGTDGARFRIGVAGSAGTQGE